MNKKQKIDRLYDLIVKDRAKAKIIHKHLKRKLKGLLKTKQDEVVKFRLNYKSTPWELPPMIAGTAKERMNNANIHEFLHDNTGKLKAKGMVEVSIEFTVTGKAWIIDEIGRSFCHTSDEFDPLIGAVIAEYRLLRKLERILRIIKIIEDKEAKKAKKKAK